MPAKPATVAYAAGASLAAVALIYVFGPTFTIDHDAGGAPRSSTVVGLRNQANDCFINSVLQALAGLGELRRYLIRETHRRRIEDPSVYANIVYPIAGMQVDPSKLPGLQDGIVTQGLKEMLDALNERPLSHKSISPFTFVQALEMAFKQRISRQQQDAQEFLQIVAERLKDEYHAGQRARSWARKRWLSSGAATPPKDANENPIRGDQVARNKAIKAGMEQAAEVRAEYGSPPRAPTTPERSPPAPGCANLMSDGAEDYFPMEGKYESTLECLTCGYKTKPREESFCTLTLAVPHVSSTSLSNCFDGVFKTEFIDDFRCERCRLVQRKTDLEHELLRPSSEPSSSQTKEAIEKLRISIATDPENPPENVNLGDVRSAPKRRIAKATRMTVFPKILAVHLSRSIYGVGRVTQKNQARIAFPEQLPLGGLVDQHRYKLTCIITHKGVHSSGHYEAFRRQSLPSPYHNTNTFQPSGIYSRTPTPSSTPEIAPSWGAGSSPDNSTLELSLSPAPPATANRSSPPCVESVSATPRNVPAVAHASAGRPHEGVRNGDSDSVRSVPTTSRAEEARITSTSPQEDRTLAKERLNSSQRAASVKRGKMARPKPKSVPDRWWRISDEKFREAKTSEVLAMQREVYLLFYELA